MFFKTTTIYKVYNSRKGAENFIARCAGSQLAIELIGDKFFVVGA